MPDKTRVGRVNGLKKKVDPVTEAADLSRHARGKAVLCQTRCPRCGSDKVTIIQPRFWDAPTCVCVECELGWEPL